MSGLHRVKFGNQESSEEDIAVVLEGDNGGWDSGVTAEAERSRWT